MGQISLSLPVLGQPVSTEDPKIISDFTLIQNAINGGLDTTNLSPTAGVTGAQLAAAVNDQAGVNDGSIVRRGKSIIATEEARTNTAYGTLTTPDRVQNIALPTDGLIFVAYQASWKESVLNAADASIFVGANQLKFAINTGAPQVTEASIGGTVNVYAPLATFPSGLIGVNSSVASSDVTTGQVVGAHQALSTMLGGVCTIFAAAGTYDISVRFKATSGSVTAKNRKLWVWAMGF